jgi:hypothetical protein
MATPFPRVYQLSIHYTLLLSNASSDLAELCIVWLQIVDCVGVASGRMGTETMTCQELLALSGALSAALPTGQLGLGSFFSSLSKGGKLQQETPLYHCC